MKNLFFNVLFLSLSLVASSAPAFARLVLYIDDPTTTGIDVLIVDNLGVGVTLSSTGSILDGQKTTVADLDGSLDKIQGGQSDINAILDAAGYRITTDANAYSNFIDGPAPAGGNELQLSTYFEAIGKTPSGSPSPLVIGASRSFVLNGQGWFMTHTGFGFYDGLSTDTQIVVSGGIDGDATEFPTSGTNFFSAPYLGDLDPGAGSYGFGSGPPFDEFGNPTPTALDISGASAGSYTMYTRLAFQLDTGGHLGVNNLIFATTPEPISIATWGLFGGGMWLTARRRRRRV